MNKYFLEITPALTTFNGEFIRLGTVRYAVDETQIGTPMDSEMIVRAGRVQSTGRGFTSDIELRVKVVSADTPQPEAIPEIVQ